jgi:tRNA (adenine37-N6)-methyltransferase
MQSIVYKPIGFVHSAYSQPEGTPIQSAFAQNTGAVIVLCPQYREGLDGLEGFSHIYILYHLHLVGNKGLKVTPFLDDKPHGIFATRSPARPNPIGISVVALEKIEGNRLYINNVDILDGTPVLDIKPYLPRFDCFETSRNGWFENKQNLMSTACDDGRFKRNCEK